MDPSDGARAARCGAPAGDGDPCTARMRWRERGSQRGRWCVTGAARGSSTAAVRTRRAQARANALDARGGGGRAHAAFCRAAGRTCRGAAWGGGVRYGICICWFGGPGGGGRAPGWVGRGGAPLPGCGVKGGRAGAWLMVVPRTQATAWRASSDDRTQSRDQLRGKAAVVSRGHVPVRPAHFQERRQARRRHAGDDGRRERGAQLL